ncbi:hypothetical protein [Enterovirga aerilata]|uniref:ABC-type transport auxiliary lipoprotein component domain-containing protein n=1 Tax=Enterovirga aerilata TaxID=2730920 RepID=A0A849IEM4_9HYPH|nr:hypothetical protein [Enterovirga sp. DB1703]NNM72323.1 hypothetical protein [Enterovirga sp. DB1703]
MIDALKRTAFLLAIVLPLAGCSSEFSLNCTTPTGRYLLMVRPSLPYLPFPPPSVKWITTANIYDLRVLRSDDYQVLGELTTRIAGWPKEAERQSFVVNRITSEFETTILRGKTAEERAAGEAGDDVVLEKVVGTCQRTWPQRL